MITDDLPELAKLISGISEIYKSLAIGDGFAVLQQLQQPESDASLAIAQLKLLQDKGKVLIENHAISDDSKAKLLSSIQADLDNIPLLGAKISIILDGSFGTDPSQNWFDRRVFRASDELDTSIYYSVVHPNLFKLARSKWDSNSRFVFIEFGGEFSKRIAERR